KFKRSKFGNIPQEWEIVKLRESTSKIGSGITPLGGSQVYDKVGISFIRSQNVHFDGLHLDDVAFISRKIHDELKNTKLRPLDVLLNITGASIGRCTYLPEDFGEGNVNQHVCIIRTTEKLNPIFLAKYLSQPIMQNRINSAQAGLSRQGLTFKEIADFDIVLPPVAEQKKITSILSNIDSLIQKRQEYKSKLETLKKGLMQKLLTGQIRVKV
ncbi:MAG: restriction endonuclease subunit S, partial [Patescibacteria group bacterium]|nr:restriction endonuclease subunit S [Patescibacteria group bacterium]